MSQGMEAIPLPEAAQNLLMPLLRKADVVESVSAENLFEVSEAPQRDSTKFGIEFSKRARSKHMFPNT